MSTIDEITESLLGSRVEPRIIRPYVCDQTQGFFVAFFPISLFDSNALKLEGTKQVNKKLIV